MKASQVVWLGVKLQEELLKIWTHYKEKHGEQNSRYFEIWTFYMLLTSCVSIVVSGNFCCFKLAFPSLLFLSKDKVKLNTWRLHELIVGFFLRCELGLPVPIVDKYHHLTWFVSQLHNSTLYCFSSVSKWQKNFNQKSYLIWADLASGDAKLQQGAHTSLVEQSFKWVSQVIHSVLLF